MSRKSVQSKNNFNLKQYSKLFFERSYIHYINKNQVYKKKLKKKSLKLFYLVNCARIKYPCVITGRMKGVRFGLNRIILKQYIRKGFFSGLKKLN